MKTFIPALTVLVSYLLMALVGMALDSMMISNKCAEDGKARLSGGTTIECKVKS